MKATVAGTRRSVEDLRAAVGDRQVRTIAGRAWANLGFDVGRTVIDGPSGAR